MSQAGSFVNSGGGSGGIQSINTDNGIATPNNGVITIAGGTNINTAGSGSTITVNLDDSVNLSGSLTAGTFIDIPRTTSSSVGVIQQNGTPFIHNYTTSSIGAPLNIFIGSNSGNFSLTSSGNIGIGYNVGSTLTLGSSSTIVGHNSGINLTTGNNNCFYGANSSTIIDTGSNNCAFGVSTLNNVINGSNNIAIGSQAGFSLGATSSNNIIIGNIGEGGDNGVIRIGTNDTHTSCFIAGNTTINGSLATSTTLTAGTGLTITTGNLNIPTTTSSSIGVINKGGASFIHNFGVAGDFNTFVGSGAGNFTLTSGTAVVNTGIGAGSLAALTTGAGNTGFGTSSLSGVTTGRNNIAIGNSAGNAITTTSNNINIANAGVVTDSGTIRIGTNGTQTSCFIQGIRNVTPSVSDVTPMIIDTNGQLGTAPAVASWTPVLQFGGATTGITYNIQIGSYYKIGKVVYINCSISISSVGTATGNATIIGLPFTSNNGTIVLTMGNTVLTQPSGATQFVGILSGGSSTILLQSVGSGVNANLTNTQFSNGSQFTLSGFYFTA